MKLLKKIMVFALCAGMLSSLFMPCVSDAAKVKTKKITLNKKSVTLKVGRTFKVKVKKVKPRKASKKVTFKTSAKKIATVSKKGVIKGVSKGKAIITVTSKSNKKAKAKVKVKVTNMNKPTPEPEKNRQLRRRQVNRLQSRL